MKHIFSLRDLTFPFSLSELSFPEPFVCREAGVGLADTAFRETFNMPAAGVPPGASRFFPCLLYLAAVIIAALLCLLALQARIARRQRRRIAFCRRRNADQLRFIRSLLDLCYAYRESPFVFLDKFQDSVNIRHLKSFDLLDLPDDGRTGLKEEERLLCLLIDRGFTFRELCVIFNLKKINNLYVKYHRIRRKLGQE